MIRPIAGMIAAALLAASSCATQPAFAHHKEVASCAIFKAKHVKKVRERVNPNGTLSEEYDRNRDGQTDIETVSYIHDTDDEKTRHAEHPFMYIVDTDYDGLPDVSYVDPYGRGKCADIVPYSDFKINRDETRTRDAALIKANR